ncbi:hypothetical protein GCM10012284_00190 [Mangrovihabitans endophyticus]|uniref:VWFA domain-containing protein n=1 Tax=Mangrovihabitans endophyticus TaxID=1751298 RepID=A0A8J3BVA4_9ACTN|nr:hypothetical protein GCM10012284_00190 [Mangrovihabitans endophyticus]
MFAVLLSVIVTAGGAVWWQRSRWQSTDPSEFCPAPALRVVAAPEIEPVVRQAVRDGLRVGNGASCRPIEVTAQQPAATAAAAGQPDIWIPSSSAWLRTAAVNGARYRVDGPPIAWSPVVIAVPEGIGKLVIDDGRTSWARLVQGVAKHDIPAVAMPDPLHDTVGMLSVFGVQAAMARTTDDAGIAQLRALTLRSRLRDATADPTKLLAHDAAASEQTEAVYDVGVFPVLEQQWRAYQRSEPRVRLAAARPADAPVTADYPVAVSPGAEGKNLTARVVDLLHGADTRAALTGAGFRIEPDSSAPDLPDKADQLLGPALQWSQYRRLSFQVLLLVDASGSMNDRIKDKSGKITTKEALLRQSGVAASELFGEDTSIGMWVFGTPEATSPPHAEVVPFGPITAAVDGTPRRDVLSATIKKYDAPDVAGTPLYRTVLDGVAAMRKRVKPGVVTLVVVLTDGQDRESRYAMSRADFLDRLGGGPPVPVFGVGYGPTADMGTLQRMSEATGGKAFAATNPADLASAMARTFLAAHAPD